MSIYQNKLLKIDLTKKEFTESPIASSVIDDFVGGRGFGIEYLYHNLTPSIDPLSSDNVLLMVSGILGGTNAPGFSRWMVMTKSPLTGAYIRSVCGGKFGAAIKKRGYDFIAFHGKADKSVYVHITQDGVKFEDASELWGLDTFDTQDRLWKQYGKSNTNIACIGPAGEKLVKFAAIIHEKRAAARGGVGAVMGSKNLKAVAIDVSGSMLPNLNDSATFLNLVKSHNDVLKTHERRKKLTTFGTTFLAASTHKMGIYPVKNFQEGVFPGIEKLSAEEFAKLKVGDYGCYSCTTRCGNIFKVKEGPYAGIESEGPEYETIFSFGGEIANNDIGAIIAADSLCDRLGLDTISMGVVVGFVMELYQRGILTSHDLDGLTPTWGNTDALFTIIKKVTRREGVGNILAEGTFRSGEIFGKNAVYYSMTSKKMELPGYEPRSAKVHGLGYATSNIGGSHMYGYARQEISGFPEPRVIDRFADEGKGDIAGWNQIKKAIEEIGILCNFADSNVTPQLISDLFVAATGRQELKDPHNLNKFGERIIALERCFNVREGLSRKDDTLPERMFKEPLQNAGPATGQVIAKMEVLLDEYYSFMDYDKNGIPTEDKLRELGLANVAEDMEKYRNS